MRTKELPSNVLTFKEVRAFARTNRMARLIELPKPTAQVFQDFLKDNVYTEEERLKLIGIFRGIDRIPYGNISLTVSRRDINRIAEIFEFRVNEDDQQVYASDVFKSLITIDQTFKLSGGNSSYSFQDRMLRLRIRLNSQTIKKD